MPSTARRAPPPCWRCCAPPSAPPAMARIDAFLELGRRQGGSDIHFTVGLPPLVRLDGHLAPIQYRAMTVEEIEGMVSEILASHQAERYRERGSVDLAYTAPGIGRFR